MSDKNAPDHLIDVIVELRKQEDSADIPIEKLLNIFSSRVYGPMLLIPALLAVLPTGAIPGVPTLAGIIVTIVSIQLIISIEYPWLPNKITNFEITRKKLDSSLDKLEKPVNKIEEFIKPRVSYLTKEPWLNVIGLISFSLGISMAPLEILPFAVMVPGLSLLLISVGLTMHDGIWILIGIASSLITYWLVYKAIIELTA